MTELEMKTLYNNAYKAGMKALNEKTPTPMLFGEETSLFSGKIDTSKPTYYVSDGPCGFAWITVKPGNSKFARWLKKSGLARTDSYYGGVSISVREGNQSYELKTAFAYAFSKVLSDAGIKSYAMSRMD